MGRIEAGKLRERVTLLTTAAPAPVADGYGYAATGPDTEQPLWARVRPLRVGEVLQLGQVANTQAYEITIRRRPGVAPTQRVRWKELTLNVQGVTPDETNEYLLLTCFTSGK